MPPRESAQTLAHLTVRRAGAAGARPRLRLRAARAARGGARPARRRDRHQPTSRRDHPAQCAAQRRRRGGGAGRRPLRARGRRTLRAAAHEPALRHLARRRPALPGQRLGTGRAVPAHRHRRRRATRGERRCDGVVRVGDGRRRRRLGGAARLGGRNRLRCRRSQLRPERPRRVRDALDRAVGGYAGPRGTRRGDRPVDAVLRRGRDRGDLVRRARAAPALGRRELVRGPRRCAAADADRAEHSSSASSRRRTSSPASPTTSCSGPPSSPPHRTGSCTCSNGTARVTRPRRSG